MTWIIGYPDDVDKEMDEVLFVVTVADLKEVYEENIRHGDVSDDPVDPGHYSRVLHEGRHPRWGEASSQLKRWYIEKATEMLTFRLSTHPRCWCEALTEAIEEVDEERRNASTH